LATFKSHMNLCELQYRQGNKQALMVALQIYFGLYQHAGRPPPVWLSREFNAASLAKPKSWDDVFGRPVRGMGEDVQTTFEMAQEHRGAGVGGHVHRHRKQITQKRGDRALSLL
jgi:hypothetical protein